MSDYINRQDVLTYIDRVANSGMGKKKSLEYIRKYVEKADRKTEPQTDVYEYHNGKWTKPQTYITEDRDTQILDAWRVHQLTDKPPRDCTTCDHYATGDCDNGCIGYEKAVPQTEEYEEPNYYDPALWE